MSWRCANDGRLFCPEEGCSARDGCARFRGWSPEKGWPPSDDGAGKPPSLPPELTRAMRRALIAGAIGVCLAVLAFGLAAWQALR